MAFDANSTLSMQTKSPEVLTNEQKDDRINKVWMRNPYAADLSRWKLSKTAADIAQDIDRPVRICKRFSLTLSFCY